MISEKCQPNKKAPSKRGFLGLPELFLIVRANPFPAEEIN